MHYHTHTKSEWCLLTCIVVSFLCCLSLNAVEIRTDKLLDATRVKGGLIIQIGCESGHSLVSLLRDDKYLIQGLTRKQGELKRIRNTIQNAGVYGQVTAKIYDSNRLPYSDSTVNLAIIAHPDPRLGTEEIRRVLVPKGTAVFYTGDKVSASIAERLGAKALKGLENWSVYKKEWPTDIDEWTHYMHDPAGTTVSSDKQAGPPRGLRWWGGPKWARTHEQSSSLHAMVSANGRVFTIMDEGPTESIQLPSDYTLTARDAFNGKVLWKRDLQDWFNHLYPLKSGPGYMPRRLVAVDDTVYLAPGIGQNLLALDASNGEIKREYPATSSTFELICSDGILLVAVDPNMKKIDYKQQDPNCWHERDRASNFYGWKKDTGIRILKAIDANTGMMLWGKKEPIVPMCLAAKNDLVCIYTGNALLGLDKQTGKEEWCIDADGSVSENEPASGQQRICKMDKVPTGYAGPRLQITRGKVVFSPKRELYVLDAQSGEMLWTRKDKDKSGHYSPEDLFVLKDLVWVLGRRNNGVFHCYDLDSGKKVKNHSNPIDSFYIHQRCYPGKATEKYLFPPMMGVTIYDIENNKWEINHWARGSCIYGMMPANGLFYATPHACACYYQSKLTGFSALAPSSADNDEHHSRKRLIKGPAYGSVEDMQNEAKSSSWPVFRHDNQRSGFCPSKVPAQVEKVWQKRLCKPISQPTIAGKRVFVAAIDKQTVYALDKDTGKTLWEFIAGGRVNSPPTIYRGVAYFGCADGSVYAVRADNGELVWQYQAAPNCEQIVSENQMESVWPIHGSVLIVNEALYCVAGRSMFLDGGLRLTKLDPETGELLSKNIMDELVPGTDNNLQSLLMGKHMPVALPDILSSDGKHIYMRSQTFDMDGKRIRINPQRPDTQYGKEVHLFSPIGMLDDSWIHRGYWIYGRAAGEGWAEFQFPPKLVPCGRIMALDEENAYVYGRDPNLMCNCSINEYRLFATQKKPEKKAKVVPLEGTWTDNPLSPKHTVAAHTVNWKQLSNKPTDKLRAYPYKWLDDEPRVIARAMVLADNTLFIAGPADVADERDLWGKSNSHDFQKSMREQAEWIAGKHGGFLVAIDKHSGKQLAEYRLDDIPRFDGLVAADGNLFMATEAGSIACWKGR